MSQSCDWKARAHGDVTHASQYQSWVQPRVYSVRRPLVSGIFLIQVLASIVFVKSQTTIITIVLSYCNPCVQVYSQ